MAATIVSGLIIFGFVYRASDQIMFGELREGVAADRASLALAFEAGGAAEAVELITGRLRGDPQRVFILADPQGRRIAGNLSGWPPTLGAREEWRVMRLFRTGVPDAHPIGLATVRLSGGYLLAAGRSLEDTARLRRSLEGALTGALLLGIPLGVVGASLLVFFINTRVNAMADVAGRVAEGDLSRRIETYGASDPFDRLGTSLNAMLERIEGLMGELQTLSDALAHDLRSPLTRIRARAELALSDSRNPEVQTSLAALLAETDRLLRLLSDTLQVSRAEAGIGRERFETVELGAVLDDLGEVFGPVAEENGVQLQISHPGEPVRIEGSRQLLAQALSNLIENALRYAADGGEIRLTVDRAETEVRIAVSDRGPGIAPGQRAQALKRFGRLDPARTKDGAGLGLALVGAVARLHGGSIALEDNRPGLRVVMKLPHAL